ncbi:M56 family metallopeptidase, partial [Planctomycetota bacterium]
TSAPKLTPIANEPTETTATQKAESSIRLDSKTWLFAVWTLGVAVVFVRLVGQWIQLRRSLSHASPVNDSETLAKTNELCKRLGISSPPTLLFSECAFPFVTGILRPVTVVPQELQNSESELEAVLLHELAHVKRRDLVWNWLALFVGVVFFFHPLVWLARQRWRLDQEIAADQLALLNVRKNDCVSYVNCLIHFVSLQQTRPSLSLQVSESFCQTKQRIEAIGRSVSQPRMNRLAVVGCALAAFMAVFTSWSLSPAAGESSTESVEVADERSAENGEVADESSTANVEAALALLEKHGDVRSFFEPTHQEHWVQIILKGKDVTNDTMLLVRDVARRSPVRLSLRGTNVTAEGLVHLHGSSITAFAASKSVGMDDAAMAQLSALPKLETLQLSVDDTTDAGLASLQGCKALETLRIFGKQLSGVGLEPLAQLPELRELDFGESFGESAIATINKFPHLEKLGLPSAKGARMLSQITFLHQLKSIDLPGATIDDEFANTLTRCVNLRQLWLSGATFTSTGLKAIGNLTELTHLSIPDSSIDDTGMYHFAGLSQLRWLDLTKAQVGDDSMTVVAKFPRLRQLFLSGTSVGETGLQRLSSLTELRHLNVEQTHATECPPQLAANPRLRIFGFD